MHLETAQSARRLPSAEVLFGVTGAMRKVREEIERAIADDLPVLIEGESGTGKELIGQYLHAGSRFGGGRFLKLNCAASPPNLLGAEMFGHRQQDAKGAPSKASGPEGLGSGGTIFLDEIGDLHSSILQMLIQALKTGRYHHFDEDKDVDVNARIICASRTDLEAGFKDPTEVRELMGLFGRHRVDLLPLRERKEDIPQLCGYLLEKFSREFGRPAPRLGSAVLEAFQRWTWPGNIRELENWIARIVIFGAEDVIDLEFTRQLLALEEASARSRRNGDMKTGRLRRLRRH